MTPLELRWWSGIVVWSADAEQNPSTYLMLAGSGDVGRRRAMFSLRWAVKYVSNVLCLLISKYSPHHSKSRGKYITAGQEWTKKTKC